MEWSQSQSVNNNQLEKLEAAEAANLCLPSLTFGYLYLQLPLFTFGLWLPFLPVGYIFLPLVTFPYFCLTFLIGPYRALLGVTWPYWALLGVTEPL